MAMTPVCANSKTQSGRIASIRYTVCLAAFSSGNFFQYLLSVSPAYIIIKYYYLYQNNISKTMFLVRTVGAEKYNVKTVNFGLMEINKTTNE
ncbi:hypothetical protein QTP88_012970 [Uroleucon formosanum]